jgi:hypothetical protein
VYISMFWVKLDDLLDGYFDILTFFKKKIYLVSKILFNLGVSFQQHAKLLIMYISNGNPLHQWHF